MNAFFIAIGGRSNRILIAFVAITLAAVLSAGWLTYRDYQAVQLANEWVRHSDHVLLELSEIDSSLNGAEASQRGLVITGDRKYLDRYQLTLDTIKPALAAVRQTVSDNPRQQARLDQLTVAVDAKFAEMAQVLAARTVPNGGGFAAAQAIVQDDRGYNLMRKCRARSSAVRLEEERLLGHRRAWLAGTMGRLFWTLYGFKVASVVFLFLLWRLLYLAAQPTAVPA